MIEWVGYHAATDSSYSSVLESPNMPLRAGCRNQATGMKRGETGSEPQTPKIVATVRSKRTNAKRERKRKQRIKTPRGQGD